VVIKNTGSGVPYFSLNDKTINLIEPNWGNSETATNTSSDIFAHEGQHAQSKVKAREENLDVHLQDRMHDEAQSMLKQIVVYEEQMLVYEARSRAGERNIAKPLKPFHEIKNSSPALYYAFRDIHDAFKKTEDKDSAIRSLQSLAYSDSLQWKSNYTFNYLHNVQNKGVDKLDLTKKIDEQLKANRTPATDKKLMINWINQANGGQIENLIENMKSAPYYKKFFTDENFATQIDTRLAITLKASLAGTDDMPTRAKLLERYLPIFVSDKNRRALVKRFEATPNTKETLDAFKQTSAGKRIFEQFKL
jgi:hypothetical protein